MRLTKQAVLALSLPAHRTDWIVFDDALRGFGLRLRAGGKRTWIVQYRVGVRQRRLTLGNCDVLDISEARQQARTALAKVGLAIDPQEEKERRRAEAGLTLGPMIERYLGALKLRLRPRSHAEVQRMLNGPWRSFHGVPVKGVTRAAIAATLTAISTERGPSAADHARTALSAFFTWAMREGVAETNPVAFTNRPLTPSARSRVLTDDELGEVWRACDPADDYGRIVRLLVLTGQRRSEVSGMRWSEVDLDRSEWTIPGARTKNGRPHIVPLSEDAVSIVISATRADGGDLIFGRGEGGFSGWSQSKRRLDVRIAERRELQAWTHHDLRRTFATRAADLGVHPHVIEAVLNHVSGVRAGVAGIYNRSLYADEKKHALHLWSTHVTSLGRLPRLTARSGPKKSARLLFPGERHAG